jgi:CBS domain-containing protein
MRGAQSANVRGLRPNAVAPVRIVPYTFLVATKEDHMKTVADILREKGGQVWTVNQNATVADAVKLMVEKNIGATVVVADGDKPIGIVSERDVARQLLNKRAELLDTPVVDIMSSRVKCIHESLSIAEAMAVMTHNRFRHLPVGQDDKLTGLISIGDVVKAHIQEHAFVIDQLEHYIAGSL